MTSDDVNDDGYQTMVLDVTADSVMSVADHSLVALGSAWLVFHTQLSSLTLQRIQRRYI